MGRIVSRRSFIASTAGAFAGAPFLNFIPARAAQFSWRWSTSNATEHPITVRSVEAFNKIRKDTNGQLDISAFPNSVLGGDPAVLSQVRVGAVEMMTGPGSILASVAPLAAMEGCAFAFRDEKAVLAAQDGAVGALIRQQAAQKNLMLLELEFETGFRQVVNSKRPVTDAADLAGLKIRIPPGKLGIDTFGSLGAGPTTISTPETYAALQSRLVDGVEAALLTIMTLRWFEVQKYASMTNHSWSGHWNTINMDKWNALPPAFQQILRKRCNEAALQERHDLELQNVAVQDSLQRRGLAFNGTSAATFKAKLTSSGYYGRWRSEWGEQAWSALEKYTGPLG